MVWLEGYTDARAVELLFLDSPVVPVLYLILYMLAIVFGTKYMKDRAPYDLKFLLACYNATQIFLCVFIIRYTFIGGFNHEYIWKCTEPDPSRSETAMHMVHASHYFWLIKAFEFLETIFFVLRKKDSQVSVLHVYHHTATFILTWFFARSVAGGNFAVTAVLNSTVHLFMYLYYLLSLFGVEIQYSIIWLKQFITRIQIIQFVLLLLNDAIMVAPGCNSPPILLLFNVLHLVFLLYMFVKFYRRNYHEKYNY